MTPEQRRQRAQIAANTRWSQPMARADQADAASSVRSTLSSGRPGRLTFIEAKVNMAEVCHANSPPGRSGSPMPTVSTLQSHPCGLLIRGFGVQVPGGAAVLTWGFTAPG